MGCGKAGIIKSDKGHYVTPGVDYQVGPVTYNLAGAVTSLRYPSGHTVSYSYDAAGRLGDYNGQPAFSGNLGDGVLRTYSSGVLYHATGAMGQERFGTDTPLYRKHLHNSRGQLAEIRVGLYPLTDPDPQRRTGWERGAIINSYSDTAWGVTGGGADNNGNLKKQEVFIPNVEGAGYDQNWSSHAQVYSYDWLNRLTSAAESGAGAWTQRYGYDRYGNRTVTAAGTSNAPAPQFTVDAATNRLGVPSGQAGTMSYDAAGNLVYDDYTGGGARAYDAENRMTSAQTGASQAASYAYDGDGRRVRRLVGTAGEVWQVYGIGGELLAEYAKDASPNQPRKEYGYRGGELLVTAEPASAGWGAAPAFTDEQLTGKVVLSLYVVELRQAIDSLRAHKGLGAYGWASAAGQRDPITAESFLELRRALDEALGAPAGGYAAGLAPRQPIRAVFLEELRARVLGAWQGGSTGSDVRWLVSDQLGTPRMVVDQTGSLAGVTRHDYFPFGEELYARVGGRTTQQGYVGDNMRQKFAGSEHDRETGLDYMQARYFSSTQGRFTSPDPVAGSCWNPQSLNAYSYVWNNPLRLTDPTGMVVSWEDSTKKKKRGETEAKTDAQRNYEKHIQEMLNSSDRKTREAGQRLQATYERLQKSGITFHVVKENPFGASSGELTYAGKEGHLYVNLQGDTSQYGALSVIQKLAHEFKHGDQFLDGQLGFSRDDKGKWHGYRDDLVDEAEAFIAGFEAQPLDPAQMGGKFLNAIETARPYGVNAVVNVLDQQGPYRGRSKQQIPITNVTPKIYAVPRNK